MSFCLTFALIKFNFKVKAQPEFLKTSFSVIINKITAFSSSF